MRCVLFHVEQFGYPQLFWLENGRKEAPVDDVVDVVHVVHVVKVDSRLGPLAHRAVSSRDYELSTGRNGVIHPGDRHRKSKGWGRKDHHNGQPWSGACRDGSTGSDH